jgi:hypothetical protein
MKNNPLFQFQLLNDYATPRARAQFYNYVGLGVFLENLKTTVLIISNHSKFVQRQILVIYA